MAILAKYFKYNNVFFAENIVNLLEHSKINNYAIKQKKGKYWSFGPIYKLGLIDIEMFKIYIKINLTNNFIQSLKLCIRAFIFFD